MHRDTFGAPAGGGWPVFRKDGSRVKPGDKDYGKAKPLARKPKEAPRAEA